jgi:hypothetical protein
LEKKFNHKEHSAAEPQPKIGMSPAKAPSRKGRRLQVKIIDENFYLYLQNLATLRLGGMNVRLRGLLLRNHSRKLRKS